jgi:hypothetical protein
MPENEVLYALIGMAVAVFAAVAAWIEVRVERRDVLRHRKVLKSDPHYKNHMKRRR